MAKESKPVHRVKMSEVKRNIIHQPLEEYDILTAKDIQMPFIWSDVCKRLWLMYLFHSIIF